MKEKIKLFMEVWKDKKKRAFISLGLWFLFFALIIGLSGRGTNNIYESENNSSSNNLNSNMVSDGSSLKKFKEMKNYEYSETIEITKNNQTVNYIINGTYFDNKYYFSIDNVNYYINNEKIYLVDELNKTLTLYNSDNPNDLLNLFNVLYTTKDNLYVLIDSSEEYNKITYKDGTNTIEYVYKDYKNRVIRINNSENENIIKKIVMDFNNYYAEGKYQLFRVTINFDNIDNLMEYGKDYSSYQIIGDGE